MGREHVHVQVEEGDGEAADHQNKPDIGTNIANDGYQPAGRPARELLEVAEQQVFRIAEAGSRGRQGFQSTR